VKKRVVLYVVFGLVFYLLFLIIEMPAAWLAWGLNQYSRGAVRLDPLGGSLWSGKGRIVIYYPQTTPHDLGAAEWNINPLWLFTGRIQMHWLVKTLETNIDTTVQFGSGQVHWIDTDATFPAQSVSQIYSPASLLSPKGQVRLHTTRLSIGQKGIEGSGEIVWQNAGSSLSSVQPLGDYRLEIIGGGNAANLKLTTVSGPLALDGQGKWQLQDGQLQINGTAVPRERATELEPLLSLLGPDLGNGRRALALAMRLPIR
jgi:general secretion pathway protein N